MQKYINVEQALEFIESESQKHPCFRTDFEGIYFFVRDELPKCEKPQGAWLYTSDLYPKCSVCDKEIQGFGGNRGHETPYCPYCGSKMNYPEGGYHFEGKIQEVKV